MLKVDAAAGNKNKPGVLGGGVSSLGPYFFWFSAATSLVRPVSMSVWNLAQSSSTLTLWKSTVSSSFSS